MHTRCMSNAPPQKELPVVLLIDDDLVSREVTATVLTMSGYYRPHRRERGRGAGDARRRKVPAGRDPDGCADARPERNAVDCGASRPQQSAHLHDQRQQPAA